jgi:hypothetical protein
MAAKRRHKGTHRKSTHRKSKRGGKFGAGSTKALKIPKIM